MRMAHLYPNQAASHHEIHLREEEAMELTLELQNLGFSDFGRPYTGPYPRLVAIYDLLADRNANPPQGESATTYSYPRTKKHWDDVHWNDGGAR